MSGFEILLSKKAIKYLEGLDDTSYNVILDGINKCLDTYLFIKTTLCNKKALKGARYNTHRLHINMKYTIFYQIEETESTVYVIDIMGINQAHSKYKRY
ncbi:hypothetical protein RJ53_08490 [Methanocalculus chunghsingensis]|uniref:Plasmid stabilization system n=1 Tax=Methanocalculus chunghsingensis TaxID=156457 RepID=A0A8J8B7C5_9EURY|nr:hypothetical protein [Methanocalculus chunghsingensis]